MLDQIAPAVPAAKHDPAFQHLEVKPKDQQGPREGFPGSPAPSGKRP